MSVLWEISKILATPQGSLVYYLLLLWAIVAGLGMAWGEWRRVRRERARRLFLAMSGLVLARMVYAVGVLAAAAGWASHATLLPPLERFADAASVGLLAWALTPPSKGGARAWDLVFGLNLALTVGAGVGAVIFWGQALAGDVTLDYNASWQASVWTVWQMGLIILAGLAATRNRGAGWVTFLAAFILMFLGRLIQWFYPEAAPHVPVWERLADLMAYPLIAVAVYQDIVAELRVHSRELQDISQASLDQMKSLMFVSEAGRQISSSLDLSTVLDNAVTGIAQALDADQCAIAFPKEGDAGQMRLVAIYNPGRQGRGEAVAFPLEYQLAVQQAMRRKKHVFVEESDNVQLKVLFALLGSGETGPLLVQPLIAERDVIGAIIVGNARSRRPFTPNEAKLCQSLAEQVVSAIQNARRYQAAQDRIEKLGQAMARDQRALQQARSQVQALTDRLTEAQAQMEDLRRREETAREARNALEIKLVSRRAEADTLSERLAVLESDLAQAHANAEAQLRWHKDELARLQAEWQAMVERAEWTQAVMEGMTVGILVADAQGAIQETNVAAEILLDQDREELQALSLAAVSDDERWRQAVATAGEGEAVRLTMQVGVNTLLCDVAPLPDPDAPQSAIMGLVAILQDISTEVEAQRTRLEAIAAATQELRTPMTTIISYADLLLSEAVSQAAEPQRKFLLRIKAGAERMAQMADNLVQEAGGEEQWTRPQRRTVDVNKLVEATVAGVHAQLEDRSLTLDLDLPEDLPPIKADPDYLRWVLSGLIFNACLASSVGGRIRVQTAQLYNPPGEQEQLDLNGDGFVVVSIQDSGGGLSDEALARVFDRARPSQTPPGLGESGAGLCLVRTLVEAHGGRLWVESEDGVGATFRFVLPVNEQEPRPAISRPAGEPERAEFRSMENLWSRAAASLVEPADEAVAAR